MWRARGSSAPAGLDPRRAIVLAALLGALGAACGRPTPPRLVVVVVVDTLRADALGVYGGTRKLTPFLDRLAARGTRFEHAYAASSWTMPSVASLFTSRYPTQHRVTTMESVLPATERLLAEALAGAGRATIGLSGNPVLGDAGWGRGFETWTAEAHREKVPGNRLRRRGLRALDAARRARPEAPLFLYLQYMEPHTPYDVSEPWRGRFVSAADEPAVAEASRKVTALEWDRLSAGELALLRALYDAEVAYVDHELARLFATLARRRVLDDAIVVVTADHGEEFAEHGLVGHGSGLYDEELRVPLVVAGRGIPAGHVVSDPVSLIDVAPTLLALVGAPPEPRFEGRSLVPMLAGSAPPADVVAQLERTKTTLDLRHHTAALVRGDQKLVLLAPGWAAALGEAALYDLTSDPAEKHPVAMLGRPATAPPAAVAGAGTESAQRRAATLRDALRDAERRLAASAAPAPETRPLGEEQRERLRALGYAD